MKYPEPGGYTLVDGAVVYRGFRMSVLDLYRKPAWNRPGDVGSTSQARWDFNGKKYEIFADITFAGKTTGPGTQYYAYDVTYWFTVVRSEPKRGTLPVAGNAINQINFSGSTFSGGTTLFQVTIPTFNVLMPRTFTSVYSPGTLFGYSGKAVKGPGTKYQTGSPSAPKDPVDTPTTDSTPEDPADPPEPPSVPLKNYKTYWNPPLLMFASGAYVRVDKEPEELGGVEGKPTRSRDSLLGPGDYRDRIARKGWISQYVRWSGDWNTYDPESDPVSSDNSDRVTWGDDSIILADKKRYGFRFHYNPGQIDFGMGEYQNINPAVLLTSKTSVMPITMPENPPSVTVNLLLNRVEDVGLISRKKLKNGKFSYSVDADMMYGSKYTTPYHLQNIATKGTMWDLEFLFRTCLGRPMPTKFRGNTADLGIFFGVPIILHLSDQMTYLGRMTSIGYAHTSFTRDMVPILTSVSLTVTRLPDGSSYKDSKPKDGKK